MEDRNYTQGTAASIGLADIVQVVFIILKLTKLIDWPWIWVLSPMWITAAVILLIIFLFFLLDRFS